MGFSASVMGIGFGGGFVDVEQFAKLFGQVMNAMMDPRKMVEELKNHLDARQVDSQVALKTDDRPEPADLRWLITFHRAIMNGPNQSQALVAVEHPKRDGQFSATRSRGMTRTFMAD